MNDSISWNLVCYLEFEYHCQAAVESLAKEKEARLIMERSQASLTEELARAQRELSSANQKVK